MMKNIVTLSLDTDVGNGTLGYLRRDYVEVILGADPEAIANEIFKLTDCTLVFFGERELLQFRFPITDADICVLIPQLMNNDEVDFMVSLANFSNPNSVSSIRVRPLIDHCERNYSYCVDLVEKPVKGNNLSSVVFHPREYQSIVSCYQHFEK
jgi:hypothetical protein